MRSDGGRKTGIRNSGIRQQQESKRESGAKCRTNLEIADKPGPMISPNHAQHLRRPVLLVVSKIIFLVYEALVNPPPPPPRGIPRSPEQNPKREHLHQVDQYDSSDELSEENEEYVYSTTTIKVQNPTLPDESVSVLSPRLQVRIGGTLVTVMMDSGASVNILDKNDYKRIQKENTQIQLQETIHPHICFWCNRGVTLTW